MLAFIKRHLWRIVGVLGTLICAIAFITHPSFPTPDKLVVFITFVAMIFGKARSAVWRFVPFVALLLIYESFRSIVPHLNHRVHYLWMPRVDRILGFGELPTLRLQHLLWHGHTMWYDFIFYLPYMMHFVLPIGLGVLIWQTRDRQYWRFAATYVMVSFMGFLTYLIYPAAPPWMASDRLLIPHITRISSSVWGSLGIHNFPSFYNKLSPNPVAAVPSLHAAYSVLLAIFVTRLYGRKWGLVSLIYPFLIVVGTVYQGEHYLIDAILGAVYASVAYWLVKTYWPRLLEVKARLFEGGQK